MEYGTIRYCPVCGTQTVAPVPESCACGVCSFPYAFVSHYAGEQARQLWQRMTAAEHENLLGRMQAVCREKQVFSICGGTIVYRSPLSGRLCLIRSGSVQLQNEEVQQYSAPENAGRNEVYLMKDGTVRAEGDNEYGQCDTKDLQGIRRILAASNCTYGITEKGGVVFRGQTAAPVAANWNYIRELASGAYHLAALTSDGRVLIAGHMLNPAMERKVSGWRDIISIVSAGDALMGLRKDGTVVFAGKENDPRSSARQWTNIRAIALESVYAIGLTEEGKLLLAGKNINDFLDMGRKEVVNWRNIVAISNSRSGIAALSMDGTLHLAGNIRNMNRLLESWSGQCETVQIELIQSVSCEE